MRGNPRREFACKQAPTFCTNTGGRRRHPALRDELSKQELRRGDSRCWFTVSHALMKTITTLLFLATVITGFGQSIDSGQSRPANVVQIPTEVEQLARGYAAAFAGITRTPIYLIHSRDENSTVLVSIKSVKAVGGVLMVQDERGLTYIMNPRDVVMITDAPPKKEQ